MSAEFLPETRATFGYSLEACKRYLLDRRDSKERNASSSPDEESCSKVFDRVQQHLPFFGVAFVESVDNNGHHRHGRILNESLNEVHGSLRFEDPES